MSKPPDHDQTFRIDRDRVSRILSLLQRQEEIAIDLGDEETPGIDELRRLLHRVQQRHQASSVFSRLPFGPGATGKPLDPSSGVPSTGAVLLAFHAGGRIDLATLAQAMGINNSRAGRELYAARIAVTTPDDHACDHMREAIGRYDDDTLADESMMALANHSRSCEDCSRTLENARSLDERLRESIRTAPAIVPVDPSYRANLNRKPMLLLIGILAVAVIALITLLVVSYGAAPL